MKLTLLWTEEELEPRALLTLHAQFIWATTTASETQFSLWFLLLEQETWGERFRGCKALKGWRRTEQQLVKQVTEKSLQGWHSSAATGEESTGDNRLSLVWFFLAFFNGMYLVSRYENRSHVEIRNWTVATKGTAITVCNDGNRKECQRSITPVALDKGQSCDPVWEMTTTRRHVLVCRWYAGKWG